MCGIAGYINLNNKPVRDTGIILKMLQAQKHRGPDDSGIRAFSLSRGISVEAVTDKPQSLKETYEGILGFNRLSILDLSFNGHQPMLSPDNRVLLTLNGEIYNAFDYKHELTEWGYRFKSTTDTEIVLALYLKHGFEGMLYRLNGMFAIVIIDLEKQQIMLTRDRFGIKPLYFILKDGCFAFSSELKSFQYIDDFHFSLNKEQLDEYLLFRNNLKGTLFADIQSLQPGHYISLAHGKELFTKQYFDINQYKRSNKTAGNLEFYSEQLEEWLSKSVQSQLMSDVKLGCQLSGGIDSSLVTWLANRNGDKGNFEAVSIIFNDQRFNEEPYINKVTENLAIPSHKFLMDSDYYIDHIEHVSWHLESPINHPNTIGIYKLSQRAKEYVTVLLSGEGADEVFGGYSRFYNISFPFQPMRILREINKSLRHNTSFTNYLDHRYRAIMATSFMNPALAIKLLKCFNIKRALKNRKTLYQLLSGSLFDRQVKYEIITYLPDLLIRQDKMSMAHSIENRVPFLDNHVVENSFIVPEKYLLLRKSPEGYNNEKYLLKKITANTFGHDFAFREKMGFGIPVRDFFMNQRFYEYLNDKIFPGIQKRGLFNYELTLEWFSNIRSIYYYELEALWVIISFEIWAETFLDQTS